MNIFGLIGYPLHHSFSKSYFENKFRELKITDWHYLNFPLKDITELPNLVLHTLNLKAINITIPHKNNIVKYCHNVSEEALAIGAINFIDLRNKKNWIGYNTDCIGFEKSLLNWYKPTVSNCLIIGNGGASAAVQWVLTKLNIPFTIVVRNPLDNSQIALKDLPSIELNSYDLVVNCTPIGTLNFLEQEIPLNYNTIHKNLHFYDLVYNPSFTPTMHKTLQRGGQAKNGLEMLKLQADEAWNILQKK